MPLILQTPPSLLVYFFYLYVSGVQLYQAITSIHISLLLTSENE